jgi:hypothetical protein
VLNTGSFERGTGRAGAGHQPFLRSQHHLPIRSHVQEQGQELVSAMPEERTPALISAPT